MPTTNTTYNDAADIRELLQAAFVTATPDLTANACQVVGCNNLTYAELRAPSGRVNVCYQHYEEVRGRPSADS